MREYLEHVGLKHDFGMLVLMSHVPNRLRTHDAALKEGKPSGEDAAQIDELRAQFDAMKKYTSDFMQSAMLAASKPPEKPLDQRRFAPASTLQSSGELSRETAHVFLTGIEKILMSDESVQMLVDIPAEDEQTFMKMGGMTSIAWQREYLEHCGVQQDFGCQVRWEGEAERRRKVGWVGAAYLKRTVPHTHCRCLVGDTRPSFGVRLTRAPSPLDVRHSRGSLSCMGRMRS